MLKIDVSKNIKSVNGQTSLEISAELNSSEITGIYGNSGEGKSTLFNIISGITSPEKGKVIFKDKIWFDSTNNVNVKTQKRNVSYIFQQNSLFPHFTVEENITFASKKGENVNIAKLLDQVEMSNMGDRYPHQLSGGQIQRIAIARALAQKAQIVLMDEPFSALDLEIKQKLYKLIKEFKKEYNLMVLMVTHDVNDIFYLADKVLWIKDHQANTVINNSTFKTIIENKIKAI